MPLLFSSLKLNEPTIVVLTVASALGLIFILRLALRTMGHLLFDRKKQRFLWELFVSNAGLFSALLLMVTYYAIFPLVTFLPELGPAGDHAVGLVVVGLVAMLAIRMVLGFSGAYLRRYDISAVENLRARKVHTQVRMTEKIAIVFILLVAVLAGALSFDGVRKFGTSILASAGVLGIILGFAAQKSLGLIFAGIQIAITQPIRLEDAVLIENEWGWIEEINLTYVVVRLWDRRRLILPINYFLEKPFQNWTRSTSDLLGTVLVYLDYQVPVEEVRKATKEIVKKTPLWNGEVCVVQVTEFMSNKMQLRILATGNSSPQVFELRCFIRENLLAYLLENYPEALPRVRLEANVSEKPADTPRD